jgi:hypothetical protein
MVASEKSLNSTVWSDEVAFEISKWRIVNANATSFF